MKITFHGAAKTVTGSQHLIEINNKRILLDCGLFQGKRKESFELNRTGFCTGANIDALVLSHAHIDHSGNIPCLVRNGFQGKIYSTHATQDLCKIMLRDSAFIQERDVEYVNRKRKKERKKAFEPLYTQIDAEKANTLFSGIAYHTATEIFPGVTLSFFDAGHMLGSAHVVLDLEDKETGVKKRLVFSGDIGRNNLPIIKDPEPIFEGTDILLIESTYGDRNHPAEGEIEDELMRIINDTRKRSGFVIIPAFAVGRTQQLVFTLNRLFKAGKIPAMPVYVDSPLAIDVTETFRKHTEVYDEETLAFMKDGDSPFSFQALKYTRSVEDSKKLNASKEPAIVISASGMMEHGRILHHMKNRISDPKNSILVTGWQAPNTLGRRLIEGEKTVRIFGNEHPVKAKIEIVTGLSGHADKTELTAWAAAMKKKPEKTFVVHGEPEAANSFAEVLRREVGFKDVAIPDLHQTFVLNSSG